MKQHLQRQSGVANVEVSLINGTVDVTPKEDGQIEPAKLLKATYDSGVSVVELDMTATGKLVKDSAGNVHFEVNPNQSFAIVPSDLAGAFESLVGSSNVVNIRGQLYKKPAGKQKKTDISTPLKLRILELKKE